jgi:acyl carrier protein
MNDIMIKEKLQQFISDTFIKGKTGTKLIDSDSFFENDVIDSTGVLELVLFIEQTFGFRVEDEEIIPENLDSINRLVTYINSKTTKS